MANCTNCTVEYVQCLAALDNATAATNLCLQNVDNLTAQYSNLLTQYNTATAPTPDPCALVLPDYFDVPLHIGSVFIVLVASALGCGIPVLAKYMKWDWASFAILCGKCMGTGVVLACGFIHMLQPGAQSLTSPCVPWEFNTDYNAYAYLYAMLAGMGMQFLDFCFTEHAIALAKRENSENPKASELQNMGDSPQKLGDSRTAEDPHTGHFHPTISMESRKKIIEAYMIEFGVTTHSVFIGLAVGVVDFATLQTLLTALCFHQFFEGVALGARISDAKFPHLHEIGLATVFSVASPIGIAVGTAVVATLNVNGQTFLLIQGTFDSICGGILIYLGYSLLLIDFSHDIATFCRGQKDENRRKFALYACLSVGAGLMAFIGKYL